MSISYAGARHWDDLAFVLTGSLRDSPFDEMILLLHTALPNPFGRKPMHIREVSYDKLDDVPRLLLSTASSAMRPGATSVHPQHWSHVKVATEVKPGGGDNGQGQQKFVDIPQESIAGGTETEVVPGGDDEEETDGTRVNAAKIIQDVYRRYLGRKRTDAARKIQAAYRSRLKRKSVVRKGIEATQAHYWHLLRKRSKKMEWTKDSRYYLLFRVPLAYILVCLDTIKSFADSGKKEAKKRMMAEDHRKLEEVTNVLTQHRCGNVNCSTSQV